MFANPVAEVDSLRVGQDIIGWVPNPFDPKQVKESTSSVELPTDLLDIRVEVEFGNDGEFELGVPGATVLYDVARRTLTCNGTSTRLDPLGGSIKLRILVDRGSIEVFANDGRVAISRALGARTTPPRLTERFRGEETRLRSFKVAEMGSAWR